VVGDSDFRVAATVEIGGGGCGRGGVWGVAAAPEGGLAPAVPSVPRIDVRVVRDARRQGNSDHFRV
jgi:hypothetical protein